MTAEGLAVPCAVFAFVLSRYLRRERKYITADYFMALSIVGFICVGAYALKDVLVEVGMRVA